MTMSSWVTLLHSSHHQVSVRQLNSSWHYLPRVNADPHRLGLSSTRQLPFQVTVTGPGATCSSVQLGWKFRSPHNAPLTFDNSLEELTELGKAQGWDELKDWHVYTAMYKIYPLLCIKWGLPVSSAGKESACDAGDPGSIPGSGRCPGEGNSNPLQYSSLENPMNRGAWQATVHGVAQSRTRLSEKHRTARKT